MGRRGKRDGRREKSMMKHTHQCTGNPTPLQTFRRLLRYHPPRANSHYSPTSLFSPVLCFSWSLHKSLLAAHHAQRCFCFHAITNNPLAARPPPFVFTSITKMPGVSPSTSVCRRCFRHRFRALRFSLPQQSAKMVRSLPPFSPWPHIENLRGGGAY